MTEAVTVKVLGGMRDVDREAWDSLWTPSATPFMRWDFLETLEDSGAVGQRAGWWPRHLTVWRGSRLIAAAPMYLKVDSMGDFARDWHWANAAERAGVAYYPKLVITVPFTPVSGTRFLVAEGESREVCTGAMIQAATAVGEELGASALHVLFHDAQESSALTQAGLAERILIQFHWRNYGYESPAAWLARLKSKRRYQARRERAAMQKQGIEIRTVRGSEIAERAIHWADQVYGFYRATCDKFMWGRPYLNRDFYRKLFQRMPEPLEIVEATKDGQMVGGAFNVFSKERLLGRYWGCHAEHRFLHFNVCLYHSIDDCIERGIENFEGGMGGSHKMHRDFEPTGVLSHHKFFEPRFDDAIREYLAHDTPAHRRELTDWFETGRGAKRRVEGS